MSKDKNDIKIFAGIMDPGAASQTYAIAGHPCIEGPVRIMPDAHAGAGCVIGFTGRFASGIVPNVVGVDIGCGVAAIHYKTSLEEFWGDVEDAYGTKDRKELFDLIDREIRNAVPTGARCRSALPPFLASFGSASALLAEAASILREISPSKHIAPEVQLGTLGGGNHFIEIDRFASDEKGFCLVVHSGSRNFGHKIGTWFQNRAKELAEIVKSPQKASTAREREIAAFFNFVSPDVPRGLEYLPFVGKDSEMYRKYPEFTGERYMECARVAQKYAALNRQCILEYVSRVIERTPHYIEKEFIESVHNYIGADGITRKGAISAPAGEKVLIPLSMKDGIILGTGKGNEDWNFSAPHGAGRLAGRAEMKRRLESGELSMDDFRESMADVFTSSVTENTIDESAFAYKPAKSIIEAVAPAVDVQEVMKPLFNLKDTDPEWDRRRGKTRKQETREPEMNI